MTPKLNVALRSAGYLTPHVSTALLLQHQLQEQPLRLLQELQAQLKPQQLAGQSTQTLYTSATACCTNQLSWMSNELCVSISTGVPTNMFYADQIASVCKQDCPAGNGLPCGGSPSDLSLTLYSSLASCCTTKIPWEPSCVDKSNGNEPQ
eukprot:scaffold30797_cov105-Skeletonema_dohrnii-CCMP3373.AAC.1